MEKVFKKKLQTFGILACVCGLLLGINGCKKIPIPDAIIEVVNDCGLAVDFYLDGVYKFSLEYEESFKVEELEDGTYELEARRKGSDIFVAGETLSVIFNRIYTWHVLSSAKIKIINNYGETLGIYDNFGDDNIYSGTIEDQSDATLEHVPYGDHQLEAKTTAETTVATTTISVLVDFEYEWTITR